MSFNGSGSFLINTAGQPVVSGTVISSTAFNALTADLATGLSTCITKDGQTTVTANIPMANYKFTGLGVGSGAADSANLSQVQSTVVKLLASVSGTDTITAVGSPTVAAYAAGQMFYFVAAGDNTGAVTINIDSLGAKAVTRDGSVALAAGDIKSGEVVVVVYDGTRFQVVSQLNSSGDARFANVSIASALNVGGVATFTGNPVLNGGTANGVLYLNASKVATSGSALSFDGSNLNAGSATFPSGRVKLKQADDTTKQKGLIIEAAADDSILAVGYDGTCFTYNATYNTGGAYKPQAWWVSGSEQMRLTSTGLGIGTSSPSYKLDVTGAINIAAGNFIRSGSNPLIASNGSTLNYQYTGTTSLVWRNQADSATLLTLTNDGNLGLGVSPSAWGSIFNAMQLGDGGFIAGRSDTATQLQLGCNGFYDGSNFKYIVTGTATRYYMDTGAHYWENAASGTAGGTISFTQAMTLDASGNLLVGTTSTANARLDVVGEGTANSIMTKTAARLSTSVNSCWIGTDSADTLIGPGNSGTNLSLLSRSGGVFTKAVTVTSGGELLVNTTTGGYIFRAKTTGQFEASGLFENSNGSYGGTVLSLSSARAGTTLFTHLTASSNSVDVCYIYGNGNLANTNGTYGTISDQKLKQDISDAPSQWDDIKSIRFRKYRMKSDVALNPEASPLLGVVAQELEQVCPGLVDEHPDMETVEVTDEDGKVTQSKQPTGTMTKFVKTSVLLMKAAVALQEAMARIEKLEAEMAALKGA